MVFAFYLYSYSGKLTQVPPELEAEAIASRFGNIPECFAYVDENIGTIPHSIDFSKFTDQNMLICYRTETINDQGRKQYNFGLTLQKIDLSIRTNYYYEHNLLVLLKPVKVWKDNQWEEDTLIIKVQKEV